METITASPKDTKELQKVLDQVGTGKKYEKAFIESDVKVISRCYLNSGTKLETKDGTWWKLADDTNLGHQVPVLGQRTAYVKDLDIRNIWFDGNCFEQPDTPDDHGKGYGNFIGLSGMSNSYFSGINVWNNEGDGLRIVSSSDFKIENCRAGQGGHDYVHLYKCKNVEARNLDVVSRGNACFRFRTCSDLLIENCKFTGGEGVGAPVVQFENIEGVSHNIEMRYSTVQNGRGPGIWTICNQPVGSTKNIKIHHCLIKNNGIWPVYKKYSGLAGIILDGFSDVSIYQNTFVDNWGYAIGAANYDPGDGKVKGAKAYIKKNIFVGTVPCAYPGKGSGAAIANVLGSDRYTLVVDENAFSGNKIDLYNVTATNSIFADPLFVDAKNGDYHLKSVGGRVGGKDEVTSPCLFKDYELGMYDGTEGKSTYPDTITNPTDPTDPTDPTEPDPLPDLYDITIGSLKDTAWILIPCDTLERQKAILEDLAVINLQEERDYLIVNKKGE